MNPNTQMPNSHLPIDLAAFPFVIRETKSGKPVPFRCFRDFAYYALCYYQANYSMFHPKELESTVFGLPIPKYMIWTMVHMKQLLKLLEQENLLLRINGKTVRGHLGLLFALLMPRRLTKEHIRRHIVECVAHETVAGLDLAVAYDGLVDNLLFVYGYDEKFVYVFDTVELPQIPYQKVRPDDQLVFAISWEDINKHMGTFTRTWAIVPRET